MMGTFPRHWFQRKLLVSDPSMHHDTCVTHVPWCMSGSLTRVGGENVPGIPGAGACATRNVSGKRPMNEWVTAIYDEWKSIALMKQVNIFATSLSSITYVLYKCDSEISQLGFYKTSLSNFPAILIRLPYISIYMPKQAQVTYLHYMPIVTPIFILYFYRFQTIVELFCNCFSMGPPMEWHVRYTPFAKSNGRFFPDTKINMMPSSILNIFGGCMQVVISVQNISTFLFNPLCTGDLNQVSLIFFKSSLNIIINFLVNFTDSSAIF